GKTQNYTHPPRPPPAVFDNQALEPENTRLFSGPTRPDIPVGVPRLANTKSAEQPARPSPAHRPRKDALTSQLRSAIRKASLALKAGNQSDAAAALASATPIIDSMVNKGIIHRNKAA